MTKKFRTLLTTLFVAVLALSIVSMSACETVDNTGSGNTDKAVVGIVLDQEEVTLEEGKTVQLTATVAPADATNKNVTWSSDDEDCATVDQNGLVTAKADAAGMSCTITATTEDGNKTATCGIIVIASKGEAMEYTASITLGEETSNNKLTFYTGGTVEFVGATIFGTNLLPLEYAGKYKVNNNKLVFDGKIEVYIEALNVTFPFDVLSKQTFTENKDFVLEVYFTNGSEIFPMGTFTLTQEQALAIGIDTTVAPKKVEKINWTADVVVSEGADGAVTYAYSMVSGTTIDVNTLVASFEPTDAASNKFDSVETDNAKFVKVEGANISAKIAGVANVTVKVDDISVTLAVTVTYPDNTFEAPVVYSQVTQFVATSILGNVAMTFFTNGLVLSGEDMGYYKLTKEGDTITAITVKMFNATEAVTYQVENNSYKVQSILGELVYNQTVLTGAFTEAQTFSANVYGILKIDFVCNTDGTVAYTVSMFDADYNMFIPVGSVTGVYGYDSEAGTVTIVLDNAENALDYNGAHAVTVTDGVYSFTINGITFTTAVVEA